MSWKVYFYSKNYSNALYFAPLFLVTSGNRMRHKKEQEALRAYVKSLTPSEREDYALRCGTNNAYLSQIINGHSVPSPELARNLAEQSGWAVHPADILPLYQGIPAKAEPCATTEE